ncbi:MAG: hypothetical protein NT167_05745, partial [Verrucomicrobia bacterium]|nr:hypothetical protein [Verrucomicrobiota bacterium]
AFGQLITTLRSADGARKRPGALPFRGVSAFTWRGTVSLSSSGGEGQGEEVVVLRQHARFIGAATHCNVATNGNIENGPPLPNPLLQRRRGRIACPLLASARCV